MSATLFLLLAAASTSRAPACAGVGRLLVGAWSDASAATDRSEMFPDGDSYVLEFSVENGRRMFREFLHFAPDHKGNGALKDARCAWTRARFRQHIRSRA